MTKEQVVLLKIGDVVQCCVHDEQFQATIENICGVDVNGNMIVYVAILPMQRERRSWLRNQMARLCKCNEMFDERNCIWVFPPNIVEVVPETTN